MNPIAWIFNKLEKPAPAETKPNYPETVAEVLDDNIKYRPGVNEAVVRFKESRPWRGTPDEMKEKLRTFNRELAKVYSIEPPQIVFVRRFVYGCCYFPIGNLIIMEQENDGRYSVVTYLHEFGHSLGKDERATCRWSINLFRKHFPKSFAKLVPEGHLLMRAKKGDK